MESGGGEVERRLVEGPRGETERAALRSLVRLRGEGKSPAEIAAGLEAETGLTLSPEAVGRVLERVAGPAADGGRRDGGGADPDYFSGWLGGG